MSIQRSNGGMPRTGPGYGTGDAASNGPGYGGRDPCAEPPGRPSGLPKFSEKSLPSRPGPGPSKPTPIPLDPRYGTPDRPTQPGRRK